jgi:hypothetical protein
MLSEPRALASGTRGRDRSFYGANLPMLQTKKLVGSLKTANPFLVSDQHPTSKIQHPSSDTLGESSSNPTK